MTRGVRQAALVALTVIAACLGAGAQPVQAANLPVLTGVQPRLLVANGKPFTVTLQGTGLAGVFSVTLAPAVPARTFTVVNDGTVVVTLPASVDPGEYSFLVSTPDGSSTADGAPSLAIASAPPPAIAAPSVPKYSFAPAPVPRYQPTTGVVDPVPSATAPAPTHAPINPLLLLPLGIVLGGLGYLLWGRPGRLSAAERQGLTAHLIGRPVQALHIGRICLQCGRLHFVLATRRDLWQAGQFCSATCFVAAQEDDSAARAGETTAVNRMREMFVYSELEHSLQAALAGEVLELRTGAAPLDEAAVEEAPVEAPAEEELVEASG